MNKQKSIPTISNPDELDALLQEQPLGYLVSEGVPAEKVYVTFSGNFDGSRVVWNACVRTINDFARHHEITDDPRQYIDISRDGDVYYLEVGLNVAIIDKATIQRTIIMIRNYKRLSLGRHEYGARSKTL